jgi:VWFA-related protein
MCPPDHAAARTLKPVASLVVACFLLPTGAIGQTSATPASNKPTATFFSDVNVVNVLATVRDKHGRVVSSLTKDDFMLAQDGRPQTISYFAKQTDLPLILGLLVDTTLIPPELEQERNASYSFLQQVMRDGDRAFIIRFGSEVVLLQDLTWSRQKLEAALDRLLTPRGEAVGVGMPVGGGMGATLYDAIFLSADELMPKPQGRKALIVLSDGTDKCSKVSLDAAIDAAQRTNTAVYTITFKHDDPIRNLAVADLPDGGTRKNGGWGGTVGGTGIPDSGFPQRGRSIDGRDVLKRISRETGGGFFEVSKKHPIEQIYAEIQEELRNQYNLGFTPDPLDSVSTYHRIALTSTQKDVVVQARKGYYSESNVKRP